MKQEQIDKRRRIQRFLLSFFVQETEHYEEKEVNGYWLVKRLDGNRKQWEVAIYTAESLHKSKSFFDTFGH